MDKSKIQNFWKERKTINFNTKEIANKIPNSEDRNTFNQIGLPIIENNPYRFFSPSKELKSIEINNVQYFILGHAIKSTNYRDENIIILNPANRNLYFFSNLLHKLRFYPKPDVYVNQNILKFIFFQMEILTFIENTFIEKKFEDDKTYKDENLIPFETLKIEFIEMYKRLKACDSESLKDDREKADFFFNTYWGCTLYYLLDNFSELYNRDFRLNMDDYL